MSIWGIQVGEYSDYRVIGYCTSEEAAIARCAIMNGESRYDCYTYFELENMDVAELVDVWYEATASFSSCTGNPAGWSCEKCGEPFPVIGYKEPYFWGNRRNLVTVRVRKNDADLVKKVAQDAFYERLAREEEVEF